MPRKRKPLEPELVPTPIVVARPSSWIQQAWAHAVIAKRETVWRGLPEQIGDRALREPVEPHDLTFLVERALVGLALGSFNSSGHAALLTLARLCTDDPTRLDTASTAFMAAVRAHDPKMRMTGIECVREARDARGVQAVRARLSSESDPRVRAEAKDLLSSSARWSSPSPG